MKSLIPSTLTWRDRHKVNPWLFPLPSELARDPGAIGHFLRGIPEELLRNADRCPDPWCELTNNRHLMVGGFPELFSACASMLPAAQNLIYKVYSRGDWVDRSKKANTTADCEAVIRNLFPSMWRVGADFLRSAAASEGAEMLSEFEKREAKLVKMIQKKKGKEAAIPGKNPTAESLRTKQPLAYIMLTNWIRCGPLGDPGLMFYSDRALADLFSLLNWHDFEVDSDGINSEQIEQLRGRLGLRKANEKMPYITGVKVDRKTGFLELNTHDAKLAASEWPKIALKLHSRIELSGRLLYGGAPD